MVGTVTRVDRNDKLVLVSLGSDESIQTGTVLMICRGTKGPRFVGSVRVVEANGKEAVVRPEGKMKEDVRVGDWVIQGSR